MNSVTVHNLCSLNGEICFNEITPEKAVVKAYEQSKNNFDESTYSEPETHPNFYECKLSVSCGDFSAAKNLSEEEKKKVFDEMFALPKDRHLL